MGIRRYGRTISLASKNLAITLASGYMGIYHGHQKIWKDHISGIKESCDYFGIRIYGDISWASEDMEGPYLWHQRILRLLWHPDIWGYIMGIRRYGRTISLASKNLAITLASGYMRIYHGHQKIWKDHISGIKESCDYFGIRIYGDISWASEDMGGPYLWHQRILRLLWHPDIWGYIMGIWIWEYHIKASGNLAILLASGYMGIYHGHLDMGVPYQGIRESCDSSGIRIYGDISWASEDMGGPYLWHQRILRLLWHPDIWGYIMGIWIWEYHIKASGNLAILLASGYMGIYHGHQKTWEDHIFGIKESCDYFGIRIYGDISWASEDMGGPYLWHQRILRLLWHPDIWGYIMGIWIWEYHIKASGNLAILLASGYMGIYHGHQKIWEDHISGIKESCDYFGIRIYGDISWASEDMGGPYLWHQRILRLLWHPDIWGYIMGIRRYGRTISLASKNLAITLASGYMGIYHGHQKIWEDHIFGIKESCDYFGIRIYGDISWASGYGSTISRHQGILRFFWHPDIWGYIMGIRRHGRTISLASKNLAITLASGYMGIYHGHQKIWEDHISGIKESCDYFGIRIYGDISWASEDMGGPYLWHQRILRLLWHPDIWGYIMGIRRYGRTISLASKNLAITLASGYMGIYHGHQKTWEDHIFGIKESCDYFGIRIYGDISWASEDMGGPYLWHQRILRLLWHPDIWGYIMGIRRYGRTISLASKNLAITLASGYMGIYHGHQKTWEDHIFGIKESCDYFGIRIYGDISWASEDMGGPYLWHQRILRLLWHPDIWGYIMGIRRYGRTISLASKNLAITLASGYMGIYHGHQKIWEDHIFGIKESCDYFGIRIYGDISWASEDMGGPYLWHQRILRLLWHPDIWGYIMGIRRYGRTISLASKNLAITLASGYMGIYHGHQKTWEDHIFGIKESCDYFGIRIYGDISWASEDMGGPYLWHQRILRLLWHPDIWGYIMGIRRHGRTISLASKNLAITLASGYMGIYHGHQKTWEDHIFGIKESCDYFGIRIYGDISWASEDMGGPYLWHQRILRLLWHPDIWGYIMGIWIWEYHIKASGNLAILLASGYMGIYHGHQKTWEDHIFGIKESCDYFGIRIYGYISWASEDMGVHISDIKESCDCFGIRVSGINPRGKIGMLLSITQPIDTKHTSAPSRGGIVNDFLKTESLEFLENLKNKAEQFNGFQFVGIEKNANSGLFEVRSLTNQLVRDVEVVKWEDKFHVYSNSPPHIPFKKTDFGLELFQKSLENSDQLEPEQIFERLFEIATCQTHCFPDEQIRVQTGFPEDVYRPLTSIFVRFPETRRYGTRSHTIILVDKNDKVIVLERRMIAAEKVSESKWLDERVEFQL
ncbi:unnamed protein product [Caenorhabditis nigoni]